MLGTLTGSQTCCNCEESCDPSEMTQWSKAKLSCHKCKSNYNRHTERMAKNPKLKAWWKGLQPSDRVQWFQRNKKLQAPGAKKQWDDMSFEEHTGVQNHKTSDAMVDYLDLEGWVIRQRLLGRSHEEAIQLWEAAMSDKSIKKRKFGEQVLVSVFKGIRDTVGSSEIHEQHWKRRKQVEDNIDTETAREFEAQSSKDAAAWGVEHARLLVQGTSQTSVGDYQGVDESVGRFAQVPTGTDMSLASDLKRDVVLKMQQDSKLQEAEEQ